MANVSYDAQSLLIDGRRIWLVCGAIHYARVPHELWAQRISAAKQAGLNCIETYVFWNFHEPQPGVFRFDGDRDLRRFIQLVGEAGMWCVLRPGPYVCAEWDFGGMPAWLHENEDLKIRQDHPAFLQACARYLDAVMKQVADLQVTHDGPILLIQNENEWFCHNDEQGEQYLGQLSRYLRESGCSVPLINCNCLWQQVEGTIDCWTGWNRLFNDSRQLRVAQPEAPRLISELWTGWFDKWNGPHESRKSPQQLAQRLAEVSAAGAQFNLFPFHGGTNFGFYGGRTVGGDDVHMTTSYDYDAPLTEAGGRGRKYTAVKRIAMFLSQFGSVMSHLRPGEHHAVPASGARVIQQSGSRGHVIFIFRDHQKQQDPVEIITPYGQSLPIHFGDDLSAWCMLGVNLDGIATMELTNLRPWAFLNRQVLVLFGPAGTPGLIMLNGAPYTCTVPKGQKPLIHTHQNVTLVVLNEQMIDAAYVNEEDRLFVGIDGFDESDTLLPHRDFSSYHVIDTDGAMTSHRSHSPAPRPTAPRLCDWQYVPLNKYCNGTMPRYASIEGPAPLEQCGAEYGYGWYRLRFRNRRARQVQLFAPQAEDRLHLYLNGKLRHIIGSGPGADHQPHTLRLPSGTIDLVCLADNLGRFNYSQHMGEHKGLYGHLLNVKKLRLRKSEQTLEPAPDPFELSGWVHEARRGDRSPRPRFTWSIEHRRKTPLVLVIHGDRPFSVVFVNDQPIAIDGARNVTKRLVLEPEEHLKRGVNRITLAPYRQVPDQFKPDEHVTVYEATDILTAGAQWAYARWQMPDDDQFADMPQRTSAVPTWYRTQFEIRSTAQPLWVEMTGMSKGQLYLNGRNIGRYFVATHTGKDVPPQKRYYLPEPWLHVGEMNELIIFDEHGKSPERCKLVYDPLGPYQNWR
jgi:hypothetical protein